MRAPALVVLLLAVVAAAVVLIDAEEPRAPAAATSTPAPARDAAVGGLPPRAPVVRCRDSITAAGPHDPVVADDTTDNVVGPVRFSGLRLYEAGWDSLVAEDQWMKSIAVLDAATRVTLEVPRGQRRWMRVDYGGRGGRAVTLQACRRQPTLYAGGFTIDYAQAPKQGRCAELIVYTSRTRPIRTRLFDAACQAA